MRLCVMRYWAHPQCPPPWTTTVGVSECRSIHPCDAHPVPTNPKLHQYWMASGATPRAHVCRHATDRRLLEPQKTLQQCDLLGSGATASGACELVLELEEGLASSELKTPSPPPASHGCAGMPSATASGLHRSQCGLQRVSVGREGRSRAPVV